MNNNKIEIRPEEPEDWDAIDQLTQAAFADELHSSHTEHFIIRALREARQLTISLVALEAGQVVGHVAVSPVSISSGEMGWYGLGPVSVETTRQRQGIGSSLVNMALTKLQQLGAAGCVVLGEPAYYGLFGFKADPELVLPDIPPEYFQAIALKGDVPCGIVRYHQAFEATG
ncbi:N-acetyltransferase [Xanthocytophaga agilis]|uniref:N-acetyltransferase n=1 Tax=Xanthocytophaga agilis TaxID=3048010 RepID=A0AAE3R6Y0_9BACT|nr:N-acetyltransferase [Xanthocytophaga agilis]MDJ1505031.1 N-acetyltransferase [Xanthocytophaga agilis]